MWLSARLFERSRAGVTLTEAGMHFRDGVVAGLAAIRRGAVEAAELSSTEQVVIACSHEASHFLIMPRYDALRQVLGEDIRIRILTYHHYVRSLPPDPSADLLLTWDAAGVPAEDRVVVLREGVRPVCSPRYAALHAETLVGPVSGWSGLTFLDLVRPNEGWASWEDWFVVAGRPDGAPRRVGFDCYTYVLEAAAAGHGIALSWRGLIERALEAGTLVALGDGLVESGNCFFGVLTEKGRRKRLARQCRASALRSSTGSHRASPTGRDVVGARLARGITERGIPAVDPVVGRAATRQVASCPVAASATFGRRRGRTLVQVCPRTAATHGGAEGHRTGLPLRQSNPERRVKIQTRRSGLVAHRVASVCPDLEYVSP